MRGTLHLRLVGWHLLMSFLISIYGLVLLHICRLTLAHHVPHRVLGPESALRLRVLLHWILMLSRHIRPITTIFELNIWIVLIATHICMLLTHISACIPAKISTWLLLPRIYHWSLLFGMLILLGLLHSNSWVHLILLLLLPYIDGVLSTTYSVDLIAYFLLLLLDGLLRVHFCPIRTRNSTLNFPLILLSNGCLHSISRLIAIVSIKARLHLLFELSK